MNTCGLIILISKFNIILVRNSYYELFIEKLFPGVAVFLVLNKGSANKNKFVIIHYS